jgi:hypothetical protein
MQLYYPNDYVLNHKITSKWATALCLVTIVSVLIRLK